MISHTTHPSLLARVRDSGDDEAWAEFDLRYGELIVRHCLSRGLQRADAEDVRQTVLVNLLSALRRFEYKPARGRFRSYLGCAVRNTIARHQGRRAGAASAMFADQAIAEPQMEREWERQWVEQHLRVALRTLRRTTRPRSVAIFEAFLDGATTTEVAAQFDTSTEAAQKIKERVRLRLRTLVAQQIAEEDRIGDDAAPR